MRRPMSQSKPSMSVPRGQIYPQNPRGNKRHTSRMPPMPSKATFQCRAATAVVSPTNGSSQRKTSTGSRSLSSRTLLGEDRGIGPGDIEEEVTEQPQTQNLRDASGRGAAPRRADLPQQDAGPPSPTFASCRVSRRAGRGWRSAKRPAVAASLESRFLEGLESSIDDRIIGDRRAGNAVHLQALLRR